MAQQNKKKPKSGVSLDDFVPQVVASPGFGECLRLCSVAELESVCERVPDAFHAARDGQGEAYGLHTALMKYVHGPVFRYAQFLETWQDAEHARKLKELRSLRKKEYAGKLKRLQQGALPECDAADEQSIREEVNMPIHIGLCIREEMEPTLEFLECIEGVADHIEFGPWSESDADECARRLRLAWYRWIACLASCWMVVGMPRQLARPKLAKRNADMPARDGKPGRPSQFDHVAILRMYDEHWPKMGRYTAGYVARYFGCTRQHVRNIVMKRDQQRSETNPAG